MHYFEMLMVVFMTYGYKTSVSSIILENLMNNILKKIAVGATLLAVSVSLVACVKSVDETVTANIGDKLPDGIKAKYSVSADMSALDMYFTGRKNYYYMDYAGAQQVGKIMSDAGVGTLEQSLTSTRIRKGTKTGNNANPLYYLDCYTVSTSNSGLVPKINIMEECVYDAKKDAYKTRSTTKVKLTDGVAEARSWGKVEKYKLEDALKDYPNNPTYMNMYLIKEDTLIDTTSPIYDAKLDQWTFSMTLDTVKATEKYYLKHMKHQTEAGGITNPKITFNSLKLDVVMWGNGLIKSITNTESYVVEGNKGPIEATTKTNFVATTYFTYDPQELDYDSYVQF